ncbi:UpxY family transcription antiterminator [Penaeicola halotolerans]|uniref:UpxY family transcription antiterminator n=1 Tax=Penaeicola halotolerans TaxID=2793196 RepID=UPI001CF908C4|nr:UpxY family transcription antiterminator [Penaeicola halotolerans]
MESLEWFILYTSPRAEKKVRDRVLELGVEAFLPLITELRQWSDRKKKVERPLFNGYLFVKTQRSELYKIVQVPGAVKFVHFAGEHAHVREEEINAIKRVVETGVAYELSDQEIEAGDQVEIMGGALQGLTGECVEKGNKDYFIIRVASIGQTVMVQIPAKFLKVQKGS